MRCLLIFAIVIFVCPIHAQVKRFINIQTLTPEDFYSKILDSENCVIIDIRDKDAYDSVRIENSINVSSEKSLKLFADSLDTDVPVFIYSEDGSNSAEGCIILSEKGIQNVFELLGGMYAYRRAYLPIQK
jgi:rhodanese-related sulfurtransferase